MVVPKAASTVPGDRGDPLARANRWGRKLLGRIVGGAKNRCGHKESLRPLLAGVKNRWGCRIAVNDELRKAKTLALQHVFARNGTRHAMLA